eukprot:scaffold4074_cov19-Tisochrysis_lutea.AAC.1
MITKPADAQDRASWQCRAVELNTHTQTHTHSPLTALPGGDDGLVVLFSEDEAVSIALSFHSPSGFAKLLAFCYLSYITLFSPAMNVPGIIWHRVYKSFDCLTWRVTEVVRSSLAPACA